MKSGEMSFFHVMAPKLRSTPLGDAPNGLMIGKAYAYPLLFAAFPMFLAVIPGCVKDHSASAWQAAFAELYGWAFRWPKNSTSQFLPRPVR